MLSKHHLLPTYDQITREQFVMKMDQGDLIGCSGIGSGIINISNIVRFMTYTGQILTHGRPPQGLSHIASVVVKRDWDNWHPGMPIPEKKLENIYILESSIDYNIDNYTGQWKRGPKLSRMIDYLTRYKANFFFLRKLYNAYGDTPDTFLERQYVFTQSIDKIMDKTIDKTYERNGYQMFQSIFGQTNHPDPSSYFCTEYTADVLKYMGIMRPDVKASNNYTLYDYLETGNLDLNPGWIYGPEIIVRF